MPLTPYMLILPTLTFVVIFTIYPTIASVVAAFFQHRLNVPRFREPLFYGLGNYRDLLESSTFRLILRNTIVYVLVLVPMVVTTALVFALWLNKYKGAFFRIAIFHPAILPMVSAATIWLFFFTPGYGIFNQFLRFFGYTGPQNWIANPRMSLWALLIVQFWKDSSFFMIFFLAGVQNLPRDVYEALRIEGVGPVTTFFRFTLPLLRRTSLFVTTVAVIGAFQAVDHVFIMTQGGPSNSSNLLLYHLWQVRFESLNVGRSSAITVLLVLLLLLFTLTNFFASERRTHEV
ncbi:carbohydrate ABC transporter permease [Alkalispirochaeta americana]|nr:sugar ABC transporter permease [Alkalispirochaeta americana]